jgi:hypothetical protein
MSAALSTQVDEVEILEQASATNQRARLRLGLADPGSGPGSVFVKLAPLDPVHRQMIGATGMGETEVNFYRNVAASLSLRVPRPRFAASDAEGGFVMVLEDLAAAGCRFSDGSWGIDADSAAGALEELAGMHAHLGETASGAGAVPWLGPPRPPLTEMTVQLLRMVLDEHRDELTPAYVKVGETYIEHHARIDELWESGPRTLIHGDPHIGNVFLDGRRVGFHDWGLAREGSPLRDVGYLLVMTVDAEERRRHEEQLLRHYLDAFASAGGVRIPFDQAWASYRLQTAYTVLATFLVFMPTYMTPEAQLLGASLRSRTEMALDDLEVVDALQRALGAN